MENSMEQKDNFIKTVKESGLSYVLVNEEWFLACLDGEMDDDTPLHPIYSNAKVAQKAQALVFDDCQVEELDMDSLTNVLAFLHQNHGLVWLDMQAPEFDWAEWSPLLVANELWLDLESGEDDKIWE